MTKNVVMQNSKFKVNPATKQTRDVCRLKFENGTPQKLTGVVYIWNLDDK